MGGVIIVRIAAVSVASKEGREGLVQSRLLVALGERGVERGVSFMKYYVGY